MLTCTATTLRLQKVERFKIDKIFNYSFGQFGSNKTAKDNYTTAPTEPKRLPTILTSGLELPGDCPNNGLNVHIGNLTHVKT